MNAKKLLFQVHRWLGVTLALFMVLWFVSGLVIAYGPVSNQSRDEQLAHAELLAPEVGWLSLGEAWEKSAAQRKAAQARTENTASAPAPAAGGANRSPGEAGGDVTDVADARLVRQAGEPRWLVEDARGKRYAISAFDGTLRETSTAQALEIAAHWLDESAKSLTPLGSFDHDSTVRNLEAWAPFHRIAANDGDGTEVLVSARTGEVVRVSDSVDRALFWVGNWLHLFRPLESLGWGDIRRDVLTWTALATVVATVLGLIVGWLRWRPGWNGKPAYAEGRVHPYRAFWSRWHFWSGLLGGLVVFTWIFSGFFSNLPWPLFSPANPSREELARYQGSALPAAMRNWKPAELGGDALDTVELGWRRLGDEAVLLATRRDGQRTPLQVVDAKTRLSEQALLAAVQRLTRNAVVSAQTLQTEYDSYYYPRHRQTATDRPLPVLRVDLADAAGTHVYIDPQDGRLIARQDRSRRVYRWLFSALHHWDFGWLYVRPLWDGWMLLWISFGLVLSTSSVVIGWKRLRRSLRPRAKEDCETTPVALPQATRS